MNTKCPMCGLVNFAGIEACRRCGTSLGSADSAAWSAGAAPSPHAWQQPSSSTWEPPPAASSWQQPPPPPDPYAFQGGTYGGGGEWAPPAAAPNPYTHGTVYGTPLAGYATYTVTPELADRGMRLIAVIVDYVILVGVIALPAMIVGAGGRAGALAGVLLMVLGFIAFVAVQWSMLATRGQTIGKRVVGVRIVKADTGENGGFVTNVLLRGGVTWLCGMVPYIGLLFSLVNTLFIFREDTRCIHDHIAGTVVVKA